MGILCLRSVSVPICPHPASFMPPVPGTILAPRYPGMPLACPLHGILLACPLLYAPTVPTLLARSLLPFTNRANYFTCTNCAKILGTAYAICMNCANQKNAHRARVCVEVGQRLPCEPMCSNRRRYVLYLASKTSPENQKGPHCCSAGLSDWHSL